MRADAAALALTALLLAGASLRAGEPRSPGVRVLALDGRSLEGSSLAARGTKIALRSGDREEVLDLADVLEADLGNVDEAVPLPGAPGRPAVEVRLVNRDVLVGQLVKGLGEKGFVVRSSALGEIEVSLELVDTVRFPAAYARVADPPPLRAPENSDRVLFASGDRLDGTLRSVDNGRLLFRGSGGADRALPLDGVLGFCLAPLPRKPETGLFVQVALAEGSRLSAREILDAGGGWLLKGTVDGKDRTVPADAVNGLAVRGGHGTPLSDLEPAVAVKPYWGDDPPVLPLRPAFDRAFTLRPGAPPPLRIGGRTFLRGVSCFSGTTLTYDLGNRGFRAFVASVGVDDGGPRGAVVFEVLVDGKSAWRSDVVRAVPGGGRPVALPRIDLSGAGTLALVVHAGPDDDVQDYADWVGAAFLP